MKAILITGGTGFLGKLLVDHYANENDVQRIVIYSRRWNDQEQMKLKYQNNPNISQKLRFITGDIRDIKSLSSAILNFVSNVNFFAMFPRSIDGANEIGGEVGIFIGLNKV